MSEKNEKKETVVDEETANKEEAVAQEDNNAEAEVTEPVKEDGPKSVIPDGMTEYRPGDGPAVVRPASVGTPDGVAEAVGSVCLECGRWDPKVGLPWCRACGGKISSGTKSQAKALVQANKAMRGMS